MNIQNPHNSKSMKTRTLTRTKRSCLVFGLAASFVLCSQLGAGFAQELRQEGRGYSTEIKKNFKVGPSGTLLMKDINGDVQVKAWNQNEVEIIESLRIEVFTEAEAKRVMEASQKSYSQSGDRITVDGWGRSRRDLESRFTVSVPAGFTLDISTEGGDLSVSQVKGSTTLRTSGGDIDLLETGGEVHANTSGGDVTVRNAGGNVTLKTSGGDLELEGINGVLDGRTSGGDIRLRTASKEVTLQTSGGDVEIIDVQARVIASTSGGDVDVQNTGGEVEVSTSGGDVTLRNIKGALTGSTSGGDVRAESLYGATKLRTSGGNIEVRNLLASLQASTSGGDVEVEMTLTDFKQPHAISLSSSGGNVSLAIPEKLPARIQAEIRLDSGWSFGERYDISSDFPLRIDRGEGGERGGRYIRGEGEINGGGDLIDLRTSSGDITIRKLVRP